jgi:hypothetical protein
MTGGLEKTATGGQPQGMLTQLNKAGQVVPSAMAGGDTAPGYKNAPITTAPYQTTYQPQFSSAVQQAAQQQVANQQQANPYFSQMQQGYTPQQQGLQQLLGSMMNRYQQPQGLPRQAPQQSPLQRMPTYQNPALMYRPTMQPAQQSLNRVAKSVVLQQKEAAEAENARLRAEMEASGGEAQQNPYAYNGGG